MPNLELYKIFIQVANQKNITKASQNLHISQPAVTRHIKNLETELNTILFNRTKGMELTDAGKKLYNEISTPIEKIVEIDKRYSQTQEILLGTYATMLSKVLSNPIAKFYEENPNAKIITITDNSKMLNNPLNSGDLDIAIIKKCNETEYDTTKYNYISLGKMEYVLIANNKSDLCGKKITLNNLKNKIIYIPRGDTPSTKTLKKMLEESTNNCEIKRIDSVSMSQIIQDYDNCVGEANQLYLEKEIKNKLFTVLDTDFKLPTTEIGIYYRKDNTSAELKKLIKQIKNRFNYNKKL